MNNIKNTWKGIKSIRAIKNLSSDIPKNLPSNGSTIQTKQKFQMSLTIILQKLLKKNKRKHQSLTQTFH